MGQLTDLTHLALAHYDVEGLEVALASLPRLRSLWWLAAEQSIDAVLPAGGWLTNLRRLALPIRQLHNSAAALASARQLQTLAVDAVDDSDLLPEVLRWAARRPTLELVLLQLSRDPELRRHLDAILEVQRSAPQLRIQHCPDITQHPHFCATD